MEKAVALVGPSGSGKTELICRLLGHFQAQGLRVAVLKHTFKLDLGDQGKDTWRYRQAGAPLVALAAPGLVQIVRTFPQDPPLAEVLAALAPEVDLVLVEGYKSGPLPKIVLVGSEDVLPDYSRIIALVGEAPGTTSLPTFQPHQTAELAAFIKEYLGLG
jgi:molybdopterin-guanine dinucleotide biosynthesis protein MobB